MSSSNSARVAFATAMGLLLACALLVYRTLEKFAHSERTVEHTLQVRQLLGETESQIASGVRNRLTYVLKGDSESLAQYRESVRKIPLVLRNLRQLTADNPIQQRNCDRLEALVNTSVQLWERSIALRKSQASVPAGQPAMTEQSLEFANDIVAVTRAMNSEETRLLAHRTKSARIHFVLVIAVLVATFSAAVWLLLWHYRLLRAELRAREAAEQSASHAVKSALESEENARLAERTALASREAVGRLSARLLRLQDDERRRFSRELHDGIGQYLASTKMTLATLGGEHREDYRYRECLGLVDQAIKEIRTLSHLLHPAGLDEGGFSSAAKWYAEEFAQRSGLELRVEIPELPERLPPALELALFRVVQESLTNVHRHSKSKSAEILGEIASGELTLTIADHGVGIPERVLNRFRIAGTSGVGLGGMRERIRELGGRFEVESSPSGTRVSVTVPLNLNLGPNLGPPGAPPLPAPQAGEGAEYSPAADRPAFSQ